MTVNYPAESGRKNNMTELLNVTFPEETRKLIRQKMIEDDISYQSAYLAEFLSSAVTRMETSSQWEEIVRQIIEGCLDENDEDESTILIYPSDDEK